jgi:hypothetical protein
MKFQYAPKYDTHSISVKVDDYIVTVYMNNFSFINKWAKVTLIQEVKAYQLFPEGLLIS